MEHMVAMLAKGSGSEHMQKAAMVKRVADLKSRPEAYEAAVRIQAMARGKIARGGGVRSYMAAVHIQAMTRGRIARRGGAKSVQTTPTEDRKLANVLEWHRGDRRFTDVVLKTVLAKVIKEQMLGRHPVSSVS